MSTDNQSPQPNTPPRICTIYLLTNKANGKIYVGQTWLKLERRMGPGGCNYKNSTYLYNAIQKYGSDKFEYTVLAECTTQEEADRLEDENILKYNSQDHDIGYNIKEGGSHGQHSEETKQKIAETMTNKEWSPEALEGRMKITTYWEGRERGPQTEERREQKAKEMTEWHATHEHPMTGRHHTEEAKQKIGEAGIGRKHSPESVAKRAAKLKMSPERENSIIQAYQEGMEIAAIEEKFGTSRGSIYRILKRNNIPKERPHDNQKGKKHSEAALAKMSEVRSEYWANKHQEQKDQS